MTRDEYPLMMRSGQARTYLRSEAQPMNAKTLRRLVKCGEIPARKDPETSTVWYSRDALDAYLAPSSFRAEAL